MKKIFIIIIIIVVVFVGVGIYEMTLGVSSKKSSSFTAGVSDWLGGILGGFDCAEKIARCTSDLGNCKYKAEQEARKCDDSYSKYIRKCSLYQETADNSMRRCTEQNTQCRTKAERYKDNSSKYSRYINSCEEKYSKCQTNAQIKKERYLKKASECQVKAKENKNKCEDRYAVIKARRIESCTRKGKTCLERLIDKCGFLVPSI